jgi:hypothetical protein
MIAIPEKYWRVFRTLSVAEFVAVLQEVAMHVRLERYRKHPRGPKKPPPKRESYHNGGHASTFKLLNPNKCSR